MKIILDDKREFPKSGYNCVCCYEDCILLMRVFHELEHISLDYDLGEEHTGYDVLVYMKENGIKVKHINIHSDHSLGVPRMQTYVEKHFPDARLTFNPLR